MARQLAPLPLVTPGAAGLNTQSSSSLIGTEFAVSATNSVIDSNGRLATRKGMAPRSVATTQPVRTLFEYRRIDGTSDMVIVWKGGASTDLDDPGSNNITGTVNFLTGDARFTNYANQLWGVQSGVDGSLMQYTGTGNFTPITPTFDTATEEGDIILGAFGRLWVTRADGKTVSYSALLDTTGDFQAASGGGDIDMTSVWTDGSDVITGLAAFNGALVIFGKRHIVFWTDGQGSALGIDPTQMYVVDTITGTGCLSPDSIQPVGDTDLLFLSRNGVQSISRLIQEKSNPTATLTDNVRDQLSSDVQAVVDTNTDIRSAYSPEEGFYALSLSSGTGARTWVLDQRRKFQDQDGDVLARVTTWDLTPTAMVVLDDGTFYLSSVTNTRVARYTGDTDEDAGIAWSYRSPWVDLGRENPQLAVRTKILKSIRALVEAQQDTDLTFSWYYDFNPAADGSEVVNYTPSAVSEYGEAEFGVAEWGAFEVVNNNVHGGGDGQYLQLGIEKTGGSGVALQQLTLYPKIGRIV